MERYHCQTCGHDHEVERCPRCGSNQKDLLSGQGKRPGAASPKQTGGSLCALNAEPPASFCHPE